MFVKPQFQNFRYASSLHSRNPDAISIEFSPQTMCRVLIARAVTLILETWNQAIAFPLAPIVLV